jgi:hypothetical protein
MNIFSTKTNKFNLVINALGIAANAYLLYKTGKKRHAVGIILGFVSLGFEQLRKQLAVGYATPMDVVDVATLAAANDVSYEEMVEDVYASGYSVAPAHVEQVEAALTSARVALAEMKSSGEDAGAIRDQEGYVKALVTAATNAREAASAAAELPVS